MADEKKSRNAKKKAALRDELRPRARATGKDGGGEREARSGGPAKAKGARANEVEESRGTRSATRSDRGTKAGAGSAPARAETVMTVVCAVLTIAWQSASSATFLFTRKMDIVRSWFPGQRGVQSSDPARDLPQ